MTTTKKKSKPTSRELDVEAAANMFITNFELLADQHFMRLAIANNGLRIVLPFEYWSYDEKGLHFVGNSVDKPVLHDPANS